MTWDESKDTNQTRPNVPAKEKITSADWNAMVGDQKDHSTRHENDGSDELDVSGLGGVLADPQDPQTEAVQDIVGALLTGGANITTTYDDGTDVLTVDTSALNQEEVEDAVGALVTAGNAITVNYDDPNDTLSIAVNESGLSFYDGTNLTANVDNSSVTTDSANVTNDVTAGSVNTGDLDVVNGLSFPKENPNDISSSRSFETWETNNNENSLWVAISGKIQPSSGTEIARLTLDVNNDSQTPSPESQSSAAGTGSTFGQATVVGIIPPGANFQVRTFGDTDNLSLDRWIEAEFKGA